GHRDARALARVEAAQGALRNVESVYPRDRAPAAARRPHADEERDAGPCPRRRRSQRRLFRDGQPRFEERKRSARPRGQGVRRLMLALVTAVAVSSVKLATVGFSQVGLSDAQANFFAEHFSARLAEDPAFTVSTPKDMAAI